MIHIIAAATTQAADTGTNIQITVPAVITFAGVCALAFTLVKIGDRLWGNKSGKGNHDKNDKIVESMGRLGDTCVRSREKLVESTNTLSNAMTKYIELQQASLKIAEYRYETITKQLDSLIDSQTGSRDDIRNVQHKLDKIAHSIEKE